MSDQEKPTAEDWMVVGNELIIVMNDFNILMGLPLIPLSVYKTRGPTEEELNNWESKFPGSKQMFINAAYAEMNHRKEMEKLQS